METNWKSFSSKLCQGKILLECGMVTRWNLASSKSGAEQPGTARPPKSQLRFIGRIWRRAACGGAGWAAAAACQRGWGPGGPAEEPVAVHRQDMAEGCMWRRGLGRGGRLPEGCGAAHSRRAGLEKTSSVKRVHNRSAE